MIARQRPRLRFICGFCHASWPSLTELRKHDCPERDAFLGKLRDPEEQR